jgi:RecA/RadA recombinase
MTFVGESTISLSVLPDETAAALFRRKAGRPFHTGLSLLDTQKRPGRTEPGLFQGDVVELHGESNAGKTEVLMNAVTHVVAPDDPCVPPRTAVYFDHDGRLDLVRLQTILLHHIRGFESTTQATTVGLAPTEVELSLVRAAMERVWVIRCAHTFEFVAALEVLHAELRGAALFFAVL